MGMKKKMLSATLCAVMVGSLAAPAFTVQAADDTLVYWSMWEATEPQGQVIQEAVDAYTEQTGVKVDLQFKGRTGNREALQPALDGGTQIDIFDEDIDRVNGMYGKYLLDLEDLAKENDYEATANAGLMAACRDAGGGTLKTIPYQPNVFAFFYNKDLFEQAGITEEPKTRVKALAPTSVYANADACYSASLCMVSHLYMSIFPIIDISGPFLFHPVCVHS